MYWQINECERSKTIVWTRVRIIESAPVSQYFSSSHRTECDSLDSLLKSLERNYILLSSPLLFFFFFFFFSRETTSPSPRYFPQVLFLIPLVYECVASTGVLSKSEWISLNDYRSGSVDDSLLKERNYNDAYYYPCPVLDPSKKQPVQQQQQLQPQQLFTCALCGREYTWMYSLRRHQLQCGNKEARNKCHFCSRKFYRRDRLKEHLLAHHPDLI